MTVYTGGIGGAGGLGGPRFVNQLTPRTELLMALPWDAAKLTPDQVARLVPAITRYQVATKSASRPDGPNPFRPGGPDPQTTAAAAAALQKEIDALLTPVQIQRLEELSLQSRAATNLGVVLFGQSGPQSAVRIEFTAEQRKQYTAANLEMSDLARLVQQADLPPETSSELGFELRARLDDRILVMLTDEQKAMWKKVTGEPYPGFRRQPLNSFGFRRGGFGGGGFGAGGFGPGGP
jgi:hypothetical protein